MFDEFFLLVEVIVIVSRLKYEMFCKYRYVTKTVFKNDIKTYSFQNKSLDLCLGLGLLIIKKRQIIFREDNFYFNFSSLRKKVKQQSRIKRTNAIAQQNKKTRTKQTGLIDRAEEKGACSRQTAA